MEKQVFNDGLLDFLSASPTPFHAVKSISERLSAAGFLPLAAAGAPKPGGPGVYFCHAGSIIALQPGRDSLLESGLRMVGAHTDSPCLMLKPQPEQRSMGYLQLGIEVYGGALLNPWFDRDLSLAGRVSYLTPDNSVATALVDFRDPIATVPSLAIHLDREVNKNRSINAQLQMAPLIALDPDETFDLRELLAERLLADGVELNEVLDFELCFYDNQAPALVGLRREFIASARLDNLLSCYTGMAAMLAADRSQWNLLVCNDHEEVGSLSAAGAQGPMLRHFLQGLLDDPAMLPLLMQKSMLISADNAHGVHPSYPDKHDERHGPLLNAGPVIKVNASQRYASSSDGAALFRVMARELAVSVQSFAMRADMACGSTIGPISAGELGVTTLDIGVPTFAMHSIRELAGSDDAWALHKVLTAFFDRPGPLFAASR